MSRGSAQFFLRRLKRDILRPDGGALLHACALVIAGRAHVFIGGPRAGKSTLAALAAGSDAAEALDDETIPVSLSRGRLIVMPPPRAGGRALPVAGLYSLRLAAAPALEAEDRADFKRSLGECCVNFPAEPGRSRRLLKTLEAAAALHRGRLAFPAGDISVLRLLK
ncbi:MAG: hypothetical protein RQ748_02325 [Elusimicrobiales bacterium]|nr:hypothetical protein [Elusimicrobiales bacterium]